MKLKIIQRGKQIMILHNNRISDESFANTKGSLINLANDGWYVTKNYYSIDGTNSPIEYSKEKWYDATIDSYDINNCISNNKSYTYLNLKCTALLENGLWSLGYGVPISIGNNSKLSKLFFVAGYNVSNMTTLEFDALLGCRIKVKVEDTDERGNIISDVA